MLEQIWNGILELLTQLVIPDWGVLVSLALPVGTVVARRDRARLDVPAADRGASRRAVASSASRRRTPPGIHMPGRSLAPIFAAIGTALLFLGLVFGGVVLALGVIALILTLLYWLAEGLRIYDHDIEPTTHGDPGARR